MDLSVEALMATGPVIPVIMIDDANDAPALANALVDGGVKVLEITLRTPAALEAIKKARAGCPNAIVGAGTVLNPADARAAAQAGASFAVSPGLTPALSKACAELGLPLLPGAVTATEIMTALDLGHHALKFFPAGTSGGAPALAALASPLPQAIFCPTGGVNPDNARDYLALPNVRCVGGSWLTPRDAMRAKDWARISQLAAAAAALPRG
ncbi:MAG: bifunctional 4-hydroxy-2-oxoglutarate aldolase/2-dehydro-3-deoxy-phosphogluconate aldolase [Burkholderiaceae bacterium]